MGWFSRNKNKLPEEISDALKRARDLKQEQIDPVSPVSEAADAQPRRYPSRGSKIRSESPVPPQRTIDPERDRSDVESSRAVDHDVHQSQSLSPTAHREDQDPLHRVDEILARGTVDAADDAGTVSSDGERHTYYRYNPGQKINGHHVVDAYADHGEATARDLHDLTTDPIDPVDTVEAAPSQGQGELWPREPEPIEGEARTVTTPRRRRYGVNKIRVDSSDAAAARRDVLDSSRRRTLNGSAIRQDPPPAEDAIETIVVPPYRELYRSMMSELPANWSAKIVACAETTTDFDRRERNLDRLVEGDEAQRPKTRQPREKHEVLFIWNTKGDFHVYDARDDAFHGRQIESEFADWEVTPTDFLVYIQGDARYPDRGVRSSKYFWK